MSATAAPARQASTRAGWPRRAATIIGPFVAAAAAVTAALWYWHWVVATGRVNRIVLPEPRMVADRTWAMVREPYFLNDLRTTVGEVVVGFTVGFVAALLMASLCVAKPFVGRVLAPYIVTFQAIPKVVFIPLLAVWLGLGFSTSVVIVALVAFFPIFVSAEFGLRASDKEGLRLLHSLNATSWQVFRMYRVPSALPHIFTGAKSAVNYSIVAAITSEFLGAREGLGYRIVTMSSRLQLADLYAAVVATALVAGAVYGAFELLDRRCVYWRERQ